MNQMNYAPQQIKKISTQSAPQSGPYTRQLTDWDDYLMTGTTRHKAPNLDEYVFDSDDLFKSETE